MVVCSRRFLFLTTLMTSSIAFFVVYGKYQSFKLYAYAKGSFRNDSSNMYIMNETSIFLTSSKENCSLSLMEKGNVTSQKTWLPEGNCSIHDYTSGIARAVLVDAVNKKEVSYIQKGVGPIVFDVLKIPGKQYTWSETNSSANHSDIISCLKHHETTSLPTDIWFFGDSRVRYLYFTILGFIHGKLYPRAKYFDYKYSVTQNTTMRFYWDRYLNESLEGVLESLLRGKDDQPRMILASAAAWYHWHSSLQHYIKTIHRIQPLLHRASQLLYTRVVWILQDPHVDEKYNVIAENTFKDTGVVLWRSAREIAKMIDQWKGPKGALHVAQTTLDAKANLFFNIICQ